MNKARLATIWLEGCSGCHMSILDMDEYLIELAEKVDVVFSPLVDQKEFPENVDVAMVEGAIGSVDDLHKIKIIRERSKVLIALGDCAVTGNVPAMRNAFSTDEVYKRGYVETATLQPQTPTLDVPALLPTVRPLHELVKVDVYVPGCPPAAPLIRFILGEVLEGRFPGRGVRARFG